jgi:hypothetical protein
MGRTLGEVVDECWAPGAPDPLRRAIACGRRSHAYCDSCRCAIESSDFCRTVGFKPEQCTEIDISQSGCLPGYGCEYLMGRHVLCGKLGHRSQRGLLVGQ